MRIEDLKKENYTRCYECDSQLTLYGEPHNVNGHWYCRICYDTNFTICYDCRREFLKNEDCGTNAYSICPECFKENYKRCWECDALVPLYCDDPDCEPQFFSGHWYCPTCYNEEKR